MSPGHLLFDASRQRADSRETSGTLWASVALAAVVVVAAALALAAVFGATLGGALRPSPLEGCATKCPRTT